MKDSLPYFIGKVDHWPIAKRREYLILSLKVEKNRHRRKLLREALVPLTTRVLKQEMRSRPQ